MYEVSRLEFIMALTKAHDSGWYGSLPHPHDLPDHFTEDVCYTLTPDEKHGKVWVFDGLTEEWTEVAEF
jgi:hypothetical protein